MQVESKIGGKCSIFWPPANLGEGWWKGLYGLPVPHLGSKHRYTFYLAAIGRLITLSAIWLKKEDSEVKQLCRPATK